MGVDEATIRHRRLQLAAQLAHVDVDRAVSGPQLAAPHGGEKLAAREDRAASPGQCHKQLELPHRQRERSPGSQDKSVARPDLKLAGMQCVRALGNGRHGSQAGRRSFIRSCKIVIDR
jgi:hypothetical protein